MAWNTVECAECSKGYQVQLYGPLKSREWKVSNWDKMCPDCWEESKKKAAEKALKNAKTNGLPELTGSPKQISWALSIRERLLSDPAESRNVDANNTLASYWIDNR